MKIQIKISDLKAIIEKAENMQELNSSHSDTITLEKISNAETHLASDNFSATLKSGYSECVGTAII